MKDSCAKSFTFTEEVLMENSIFCAVCIFVETLFSGISYFFFRLVAPTSTAEFHLRDVLMLPVYSNLQISPVYSSQEIGLTNFSRVETISQN